MKIEIVEDVSIGDSHVQYESSHGIWNKAIIHIPPPDAAPEGERLAVLLHELGHVAGVVIGILAQRNDLRLGDRTEYTLSDYASDGSSVANLLLNLEAIEIWKKYKVSRSIISEMQEKTKSYVNEARYRIVGYAMYIMSNGYDRRLTVRDFIHSVENGE